MSERFNIGGRYFWGKVQIIFPPTLTLLLGAEVGVHGVALEQPGAVQRELDTVPTPAEKMVRCSTKFRETSLTRITHDSSGNRYNLNAQRSFLNLKYLGKKKGDF